MADDADRVQDMTERQMANALEHRARVQANGRPGLTHCEQLDCGMPISALRTQMGARLCVPCANDEEARGVHQAAWRRR
ncbi:MULTISPECIES: hypothetical protein [Luteimonas]|uniref:hypothetical protein n=1 Tax=Luteimonas TaxID=83614 RepID=UPI000C7D58FE|nr:MULTISPECIES: hypothetical protein [Luteimonas]